MSTPLQPGDQFRISSRRMAASGTVTKVNRATVAWGSTFYGHPVSGKIAKGEFARALIIRGETAWSLLSP